MSNLITPILITAVLITAVLITAVLITAVLVGCSSTPKVTLSYYPATWTAEAKVTKIVGCNKDGTVLVSAFTLTVLPVYSSDITQRYNIEIKKLNRWYADNDMTMTFFDDGRLKAINQSTTGQGEAIIKSAVSLGTAITTTLGTLTEEEKAKANTIEKACNEINKLGSGNPITLTYIKTIGPQDIGKGPQSLEFPNDTVKAYYAKLTANMPNPKLDVSLVSSAGNSGARCTDPSECTPASNSYKFVSLQLRETGFADITIIDESKPNAATTRIIIPQNTSYFLPIPKAAFFGKQRFGIILSEAGVVTSVNYGKDTGAAGALGAFSAIANTETPTAKAADLKAQSDLIAQQQRWVLCQTKPDQCK